jgi:hypothetical protein
MSRTIDPQVCSQMEFATRMQKVVLRGVIDDVIAPFCELYERLIGTDPLHVGDYEITIRRRPVSRVAHYDLSSPTHPAQKVVREAEQRRSDRSRGQAHHHGNDFEIGGSPLGDAVNFDYGVVVDIIEAATTGAVVDTPMASPPSGQCD